MRKLLLFAACIGVLTVSCTDKKSAYRTLEQAGYKNIQLNGYSFMCGHDDTYATGFSATAPNGSTVTGAVCGGILKGNTIRVD